MKKNTLICCMAGGVLSCFSSSILASHTEEKPITISHQTGSLSHVKSCLMKKGHISIQLGGHWSTQGKTQHVDIQDLIGDDFSVTDGDNGNGLVGVAYLIDGLERERFYLSYGINAFYLPKTAVNGLVTQESMFTNLSYQYHVTHYPIYALLKSTFKTSSPDKAWTLDVGIGPNILNAHDFGEASLDGITIPDQIFSNHTTATFSATAGAGLKFNHAFGQAPLECGYRFFYLGEGNFNITNNQVLNTLKTGHDYANAVQCSITI